jgi:signal transduction histidine kinase
MTTADVAPDREALRIEALKKYEILDTPPDGSFTHIVELAAKILNVPIAIISLVDTDRIWFKSATGVGDIKQIDRVPGLCASAILSDDIYEVQNAITDPRTIANPLVAGEMGFRFYAAAPLKIREGFNLGTLCIIDTMPRSLSEDEKVMLQNLADIVIDQFELRLEARVANEQQHKMLGVIAHELRNSIATIPAYAELLIKNCVSQPDNLKLLKHIIRGSQKTNQLIEEMLEMAKLQASEFKLKSNDVDIAMIVGRVAATNLVLANAKQQKIMLQVDDEIIISADETKISEIADNLINNAIKYSPQGGRIGVHIKAEDGKAVLEVYDEGPGLQPGDQEKLFQPFTRLSARPTAGEHSTGMGLSIVKMLTEAHGGTVNARNHPEWSGAVFRVELPM